MSSLYKLNQSAKFVVLADTEEQTKTLLSRYRSYYKARSYGLSTITTYKTYIEKHNNIIDIMFVGKDRKFIPDLHPRVKIICD